MMGGKPMMGAQMVKDMMAPQGFVPQQAMQGQGPQGQPGPMGGCTGGPQQGQMMMPQGQMMPQGPMMQQGQMMQPQAFHMQRGNQMGGPGPGGHHPQMGDHDGS